MAPITMVFIITGLAVFTQAMFFLGIGASAEEGKKSPIVPVGYISVIAGIINLVVGLYITVVRPLDADPSLLLAGLIGFYGLFFLALGLAEILDMDLRVIGNLAIPTAILPLFWINFFSDTQWTLILIWWVVTFLAITLTTYGKLQARVLGIILMITAIFTFFLVPVDAVMGWGLI
ncbi:MAG: hypothetical protein ABF312_08175 [Candidatus Nanopelagicales bacterium]|jgi:uncharacterized membrane protein|nr:hypothetical protein [Actinomycetota bacterium]MDA9869660.1 hypothetical protein [bacterium]NCG02213.1 hypothetical protein [Actinomycetales bacterium]MBT5182562.1 hypothetical protein [Actinomycetota bacterium]MBT5501978.1 hypothetical protein [Actinomycetota bacterium]